MQTPEKVDGMEADELEKALEEQISAMEEVEGKKEELLEMMQKMQETIDSKLTKVNEGMELNLQKTDVIYKEESLSEKSERKMLLEIWEKQQKIEAEIHDLWLPGNMEEQKRLLENMLSDDMSDIQQKHSELEKIRKERSEEINILKKRQDQRFNRCMKNIKIIKILCASQ